MRGFAAVVLIFTLIFPTLALAADESPLVGYAPRSSESERDWEAKFRAIPEPANLREYMRRLSARPHHVGSPYDKDNAEWILARFKEWGLDAHIETFDVPCFLRRKWRGVLEMIEPTKFTAKLEEPALAVDPTSNQKSEQLPTYNAYSIDGDGLTAALVVRQLRLTGRRLSKSVSTGWEISGHQRRNRDCQVLSLLARSEAEGCGRARRGRVPHLLRTAG